MPHQRARVLNVLVDGRLRQRLPERRGGKSDRARASTRISSSTTRLLIDIMGVLHSTDLRDAPSRPHGLGREHGGHRRAQPPNALGADQQAVEIGQTENLTGQPADVGIGLAHSAAWCQWRAQRDSRARLRAGRWAPRPGRRPGPGARRRTTSRRADHGSCVGCPCPWPSTWQPRTSACFVHRLPGGRVSEREPRRPASHPR